MAAKPSTTRVRVLHLISSLKIGGAGSLLLSNIRQMDSDRFENLVCCLTERCELESKFSEAGYPPLRLHHATGGSLLGLLARLIATVRRHRIDLIHTNLRFDSQIGPLAGHWCGVPVVSTLHNGQPPTLSLPAAAFDRHVVQRCTDRFIAVSRLSREAHVKRRKLSPDMIDVIYSGILTEEFATPSAPERLKALRNELGLGAADPILLNVARLTGFKGQQYLVPMMPPILERWPNAVLLIAGEGEERPALERQIREEKLSGAVRLLGARSDVKQLLELCTLFLFPSLSDSESLGLAVLEAMATGRPVVASCVGGLPEVIDDGIDGLLVPPRNSAALADAVLRLLGSQGFARSLGEHARGQVRSRFDSADSVRRLEQVYEEVLAERRAGRWTLTPELTSHMSQGPEGRFPLRRAPTSGKVRD